MTREECINRALEANKQLELYKGQSVKFTTNNGVIIHGRITKLNRTTCIILSDASNMHYRVPIVLVKPEGSND